MNVARGQEVDGTAGRHHVPLGRERTVALGTLENADDPWLSCLPIAYRSNLALAANQIGRLTLTKAITKARNAGANRAG